MDNKKSKKIIFTMDVEHDIQNNYDTKSVKTIIPIVIDIFKEQRKMMIKHDEVPGFMMEMTMMFNIDPSIDLEYYAIV